MFAKSISRFKVRFSRSFPNTFNLNKSFAWEIVGGLSNPSKMPCKGYSIPASTCKMGSLMAKHKGTICSKCYARKGMYVFPNVKRALNRRFESLNHPLWISAMTLLVKDMKYFRWHDSGDIQSVEHLCNIVEVVKNTPKTKHWIPTREYSVVAEYVGQYGSFPENLTVRLSASKFNGVPPVELAKKLGVLTSGVSTTKYNCVAPLQNNACKYCRMCWGKEFQINYKQH